jgi:hypothetical protein
MGFSKYEISTVFFGLKITLRKWISFNLLGKVAILSITHSIKGIFVIPQEKMNCDSCGMTNLSFKGC